MKHSVSAGLILSGLFNTAFAQEHDVIAASKLPAAIKPLHTCASGAEEVELSKEKFAKAVLFFVSCPAKSNTPEAVAVYLARDIKGSGAARLKFPALAADGKESSLDLLPSATPAREMNGDQPKNDPPWVTGTWEPKDRPGICMVNAQWRLSGGKPELFLWDEAKECSPSDGPDYESKVDKKPPPLVGP